MRRFTPQVGYGGLSENQLRHILPVFSQTAAACIMREKLNTATNLLVLLALCIFVFRPGGAAGDALTSWKTARANRALVANYWHLLTSPIATSAEWDGHGAGQARVVEFTDYQCPFCKQMHAVQEKLGPERAGMRVKHLPIRRIHPNAELAAKISICAEREPHSWPAVHGVLFEIADSLTRVDWLPIMESMGIRDTASFAACVVADATARRLGEDENLAARLNVQGTPTYVFPTGIHRGGMTEDELKRRLLTR